MIIIIPLVNCGASILSWEMGDFLCLTINLSFFHSEVGSASKRRKRNLMTKTLAKMKKMKMIYRMTKIFNPMMTRPMMKMDLSIVKEIIVSSQPFTADTSGISPQNKALSKLLTEWTNSFAPLGGLKDSLCPGMHEGSLQTGNVP